LLVMKAQRQRVQTPSAIRLSEDLFYCGAELAQGFGPCVEDLERHIQVQFPVHMDERVPEASQARQAVPQLRREAPCAARSSNVSR